MKFFIDTANISEIEALIPTGFVDGVTTNPSLIAKQGGDIKEVIKSICDLVKGPVSAEVTATDYSTMLEEGRFLASLAKNIAVKVPLTENGLKTCRDLTDNGIMVNVTLCFSATQAILAAKAGATFVSPFVGRLDDIGSDGMQLIKDIYKIYDNYKEFKTQILVASVRNIDHIIESAKIGAHIATIPPKILKELYKHSLTDKGLEGFLNDWKKTGQKILP